MPFRWLIFFYWDYSASHLNDPAKKSQKKQVFLGDGVMGYVPGGGLFNPGDFNLCS